MSNNCIDDSLEKIIIINNNEKNNKKKNNDYNLYYNHILVINGFKISYLTIITLLCGIILCIYDYNMSDNYHTTLFLSATIICTIFLSINIHCMTIGNCFWYNILNVLFFILFTLYLVSHSDFYDKIRNMLLHDMLIYNS